MTELDPWDRALRSVMSDQDSPPHLETLDQLSASSGISRALLEALTREGLLIPRVDGPNALYDPDDATAVKAGLQLVEAGVPLGELLHLARMMDEAMRPIAAKSVDVFVRFVRDHVEATSGSEDEASKRLVKAFREMLPAAGVIVEHHFRRLVVAGALERLNREQ